jgi:hypothetical protein
MSKLQQTQTHSFNSDNSNKQALAQVSSGQQLVDSEESGVCMQCSIFGDDYIASKFKWFSPQLNPESMNNVCPRSFDVVGECPVCATANSTRKSKINWKSIYEINLSSAVPLIKELPASKHGSDSDRLLLGARTSGTSGKLKMKAVPLDTIGRRGSAGTFLQESHPHTHGTAKVNIEGGRTVSWAGTHKLPVRNSAADTGVDGLPHVQQAQRPHSTGSLMHRMTSNPGKDRDRSNSPGKQPNSGLSRQSSQAQGGGVARNASNTAVDRQYSHYSRQPSNQMQQSDVFNSESLAVSRLGSDAVSQRPASCHGRISSGGEIMDSPGRQSDPNAASNISRNSSSNNNRLGRPSSAAVSRNPLSPLRGASSSAGFSGKSLSNGEPSSPGKLIIDTSLSSQLRKGPGSGPKSPSSPTQSFSHRPTSPKLQPASMRALSSRGVRLPLVMVSTRLPPANQTTTSMPLSARLAMDSTL